MTETGVPDLPAEDIRKIGDLEYQAANVARTSLMEEHSASFKWLMASLLAINAGGLLALKDAKGPLSAISLASGCCFYLGIAGALMVAWLGQRSARALLEPLSELVGFWKAVSVFGHFEEADHKAILSRVQASVRQARYPAWAGWLSFLSFSIGLLLLGIAVVSAAQR